MTDSTYIKHSEEANPQRQKVDKWLPGDTGQGKKAGKWGVAVNVHRVSYEGDKNILELVVMAEQSCDILDTTEQSTFKESILQCMN